MFKKIFLHAILASMLALIASVIYGRIYFFATEVDYSKVLYIGRLAGLSILTSMLAALLNYGVIRLFKNRGEIIFNLLFSILSFAAVMIPISVSLPLSVQSPELFPGLAVPMVFFPAIAWYTVNPLFANKLNAGTT
jgi:uncharacterized membrane protein (UPF0136 family)